MGACIVKQPNGLYCRYSSIVEAPTHYNLTREEVFDLLLDIARLEIEDRLARLEKKPEWGWTFDDVGRNTVIGNNITKEEFEQFCREAQQPLSEVTKSKI